jgi:hypothetical protein
MATPENTKLCDFTSMNNNNFICTPIVPPAPTTNFYEIKPALLNFVMKEQKFMYVPKVSVPKPQHVFKIGKTFSSTKSDFQVESSSGTSKVPGVVSGDLEETVDLNASFKNT